ncbi:MAG: DUF1987 domain-containing protein [Bacteroidales bacterium]|nr:DUF1987 domain-containing protein [Bacteroidales bacterium]
MEKFRTEATAKTPLIELEHSTGELLFKGKSIPENSAKVYEGVLKWIKEYAQNPNMLTNFRLNLEYFNTSSMMWIARMIKVLSSMNKLGAIFMIHLYYDIADFEEMDSEEILDIISPMVDMAGTPTVSVCIKIYGTGTDGEILDETMVLI